MAIPCYNQGRYLRDAIESVRRQTYSPLDIIVVDDGSTDGSAAIAASAGVPVVGQLNSGLAAARNAGLAASRGEFIVFLDADDELLADAIASGVAALRDSPYAMCVVRRCQIMDAERRALPAPHTPVPTDDLYREWLHRNFVWTPGAAVFRTSWLSAIGGFPRDLAPASDYAVYLTLSRLGRVIFDRREVVRYRQHDSNMSRDPVLMLRGTLAALRRERPHVPPDYLDDYRIGLSNWRRYYGDQIVERLRRERRAGVSSRWQALAMWTLITECPRAMAIHSFRKLSRLGRGMAQAPVEAGRFGPELPPPE